MSRLPEPPTLPELIGQAYETGLSYRRMAQRARAAGCSVSHGQLHEYHANSVAKPPGLDMVHALGHALGRSPEVVLAAVLWQWYGVRDRPDEQAAYDRGYAAALADAENAIAAIPRHDEDAPPPRR